MLYDEITTVCHSICAKKPDDHNNNNNNNNKYQLLQLNWKEEYTSIERLDITNDVSCALIIHQFIFDAHTVHFWTERDCVLIDAGILALHRNVVAAQLYAEKVKHISKALQDAQVSL